MSPITVIETVEPTGTQWGVSLTGPNPDAADYFACTGKEHAWHLHAALTREAPCGVPVAPATPVGIANELMQEVMYWRLGTVSEDELRDSFVRVLNTCGVGPSGEVKP